MRVKVLTAKRGKAIVISLTAALWLSACGGGGGSLGGTRFYSLQSTGLALSAKPNTANPVIKVGVGPIRLTRLLRRPQIVTRKSGTEIAMAEKHQWGGLLKEDLTQTLTDNFSSLLGTENIEQYPWKLSFKPNYSVRIDVDQLDGDLGGTVTLKAHWRLSKGRKEVAVQNTVLRQKVVGGDYNAYVTAQSKVLYKLCQLISQSMR
ncbi:MAG: PqiC family protein [Leucothrix sp.]